jgi:hypothetical protein|nr:hypothetical protein [uncultured Schaedlerella sp.]
MKRRIEYVLNWEPRARREQAVKAYAELLARKNREKKNGGNSHVL